MTQTTVKERPILFSGPMVRAILEGRKTQTRRVVKPQPPAGSVAGELCNCPTGGWGIAGQEFHFRRPDGAAQWHAPCPFGRPGDRLWCRETWEPHPTLLRKDGHPMVSYAADFSADELVRMKTTTKPGLAGCRWRPSIHMPRWASRLTLEVTGVRVERVQDITEADARAEGLFAQEGTGTGPGVGYKWRGTGYHGAEWGPDGGMLFHVPDYYAGGRCCCKAAGPTPVQCAYREAWDSLHAARGYGWDATPWVWVVTFARLDTPPRA